MKNISLLLFCAGIILTDNLYTEEINNFTLDDINAPISANSIVFARNEMQYIFQRKPEIFGMSYFLTMDTKDNPNGWKDSKLYPDYSLYQINGMFTGFININDYFSIPLFGSFAMAATSDDIGSDMCLNAYVGTGLLVSHEKVGKLGILGGYYVEPTINGGDEVHEGSQSVAITLVPTLDFGSIPGLRLIFKYLDNFLNANFLPEDVASYEFNRSHKLISQNLALGSIFSLDYLHLINEDGRYDYNSRSKFYGIGLKLSYLGLNSYYIELLSLFIDFGYRDFYDVTSQSELNKAGYEDTFFCKSAFGFVLNDYLLGLSLEFSKKYNPMPKPGFFILSEDFLIALELSYVSTSDTSSNLDIGLSFRWIF